MFKKNKQITSILTILFIIHGLCGCAPSKSNRQEDQLTFTEQAVNSEDNNSEQQQMNELLKKGDREEPNSDKKSAAVAVATLNTKDFKIYYPKSMEEQNDGQILQVITWGNPTGFDSWVFAGLIRKVVKAGFVVVASHSVNTGRGTEMIAGLDLMEQLNKDTNSIFFKKLDLMNTGAFGHSQGGGGTTLAAKDSRVKAMIPIYPYKGTGDDQHAPMFLLAGEKDRVCKVDTITTQVFEPSKVPTVYAIRKGSNHLGPISALGGDEIMDTYIVEWFELHLKKDQTKNSVFFGNNCQICQDDHFIVKRK